MEKDIERFLEDYRFAVNLCIDVIDYGMRNKPLAGELGEQYNETLPNVIKQIAHNFDYSDITFMNSPLIKEISNNLSECKTMQEKERYIHSLLVPFKELSNIIYPDLAPKQRIDKEIAELEKENDNAFESKKQIKFIRHYID